MINLFSMDLEKSSVWNLPLNQPLEVALPLLEVQHSRIEVPLTQAITVPSHSKKFEKVHSIRIFFFQNYTDPSLFKGLD